MQFKGLALVASAFVFAACGGAENKATDTPAADAAPAAAAPAAGAVAMAPATGTTHTVKLVGDDKGYRFEPANLEIKVGDAIKFEAVSGFPHNVVFDGSTLDAAVKAQLDANFGTAKMAELTSNMFLAAGEGITISFANVAPGTYKFNCTPHVAMNMLGTVTVK